MDQNDYSPAQLTSPQNGYALALTRHSVAAQAQSAVLTYGSYAHYALMCRFCLYPTAVNCLYLG